MSNTEKIEKVVLTDGFVDQIDPIAPGKPAKRRLRRKGETVFVSQERLDELEAAGVLAATLGEPGSQEAEIAEVDATAGATGSEATLLTDDEIAKTKVDDLVTYLQQHSDDLDIVEQVERVELASAKPRKGVTDAIAAIRESTE